LLLRLWSIVEEETNETTQAADIIKERHGGKAEKPEEPEEEVPEEGEPIEEDPEDDSC